MKNLYYKLANGNWVDRYDIETAFYISTGAKYTTDSKEFVRWLFPLLGKSILAVKKGDNPELIAELLKSRQKIKAIKVYKDLHNCTLVEAKEAIEGMTNKYPVGAKVEVIADTCLHMYPIGSVLTIIGKYNDELYRVIEGDTYVTERDIKLYIEPEKPKYYNGKVMCISSDFPGNFTVGKVYEIKDGKFTDNEGRIRPVTSDRITCIEDLNNEYFAHWSNKFTPFVED